MIFFEIPAFADVEQFCARIRPRWPGWKMLDVDVWLVGATVKVDDSDLAVLLRAVADSIAELNLLAIRYCVDGRFYVMAGQNDQISGTSSTATTANRISNGSPSFQ